MEWLKKIIQVSNVEKIREKLVDTLENWTSLAMQCDPDQSKDPVDEPETLTQLIHMGKAAHFADGLANFRDAMEMQRLCHLWYLYEQIEQTFKFRGGFSKYITTSYFVDPHKHTPQKLLLTWYTFRVTGSTTEDNRIQT